VRKGGSASPFDQQIVALDSSDDMFGAEFRQMLASGDDIPEAAEGSS